jgi:hypothetical protein
MQNPDEFIKAAATTMGLQLDPKFLSYIAMWLDLFYPNGFEITILPHPETERVVFRSVLNKRFLRLQPDYLRSIYGGFVNANWVLVGQVTYLPGTKTPEMETTPLQKEAAPISTDAKPDSVPTDSSTSITPVITESPMLPIENEAKGDALASVTNTPSETSPMRDPFRALFKQAINLERLFFESKFRVEVLLRPLAIYQEITVSEDVSDTNAP